MHVQAIIMSAVVPSTPASTAFVTGQSLGVIQTDSNAFGVGFEFTVGAAAIVVTALGRWKVAGDSKIHYLGLTDQAAAVLTGGNVNVDMSNAAEADGYVYATLATPVNLSASTTYRCYGGQESSFVDRYYDATCSLTTTSDAAIINATYAGPDFPAGSVGTRGVTGGSGNSYGPVNFKYHL